jgi:ferritin-like metal-binding protein YciE
MKIDTLTILLQEELKDIYDFEKRLVRAIPKMAKAASSEDLRSALMEHLEVTRGQVERMEEIFSLLGVPAKAKPCAGMKGIIEEGEETIKAEGDENLLDVAITGGAQRVEHYEMAAYAAAKAMAERLGNEQIAGLLEKTWEEEREADEKLSSIAEELLANVQEQQEEKPARSAGATHES